MKGAYGGKFIYDSLHEILIFSGRTKDEKTMEWKKAKAREHSHLIESMMELRKILAVQSVAVSSILIV